MARAAVTFDFHNTIARCDEWFEIEVKGLVSAYLRWQSGNREMPVDPQTLRSADVAYRQLRQTIQHHGNELTAEECVAAVLDELGLAYDDVSVARGIDDLMRPCVELSQPMPGAVETVRELAEVGVPLGVVSNAVYHPFLLWTLDAFGITSAFQSVTSSASARYYKSRPELFTAALATLGASAERSVHIGDSRKFDVAGAQRAGMRTIFLASASEDNRTSSGADLTLPSLVGSTPMILSLLAPDSREIGIFSAVGHP